MAQNNILIEQYRTSGAVQKRNAAALNAWAGSMAAQPIPTEKPAADWVRARIVAERIPSMIDSYVARTLGYCMQDPTTVTNIWQYLNYNNEATEVSLSGQLDGIIAAFMPRFSAIDVTQSQVDQWYIDHGFGPVALAGGTAGAGVAVRPS
jgi:hypothetical protein